jgi:hypothetical protein
MKIYSEGIEWTSIPATRIKRGAFIDRLVGINISKNKERILVEPIYQAVLKIEREGDFTFITLSWDRPVLVIIFMSVWPFVNIVRPEGYQLEADE